MTFEEFRDADRAYCDLRRKSERLAAARGALPAGSTRARVTTANAKWARVAEARDIREGQLRDAWDEAKKREPRYVYEAERLWELARRYISLGWEGRPDDWVLAVEELMARCVQ